MIRQFTFAVLILSFTSASSAFAGTWSDGFEDPDLDEWKIHLQARNQPVWKVENGLLLADQNGCSVVWIGKNTWEDYSVEATVTLLEERPPGPNTPNSRGAGIVMYWRILPCQGHHYGIFRRLWDGRGAGVFGVFANGWGPPAASQYKARELHFDREYKLRMTEEKDLIKCYLDSELVLELKKRFTIGVVGLYIFNMRAYFDDFVVTGANIPDGGPGSGKAVKPQARLAKTWAHIKQ
jgi:hypothetical protein